MKNATRAALGITLGFAMALMAVAQQTPRGITPRVAADKYSAHGEQHGAAVGASLLTAKDARKALSTDVESCCMVVEFAVYPAKDGTAEISLDDLALRIVNHDDASKPSGPESIAGKLYRFALPGQSSGKGVGIKRTNTIGYGTGGVDSTTGQQRPGGVTMKSGAGVSVGEGGGQTPSASDADYRALELELRQKGLPEGATKAPVAGYIYFSQIKDKKVKYQLEYTVNGEKVVLPL